MRSSNKFKLKTAKALEARTVVVGTGQSAHFFLLSLHTSFAQLRLVNILTLYSQNRR